MRNSRNVPPLRAKNPAERIAVTYRLLSEVKLDPLNPRAHSSRQVAQIARSIKTFGFIVPVLINANLEVIAGHGRVLAARQLGLAEAPTILLDHLSAAQARAFMIADNRLSENAEWDERLLALNLRDLALLDLDFDLEVTGFEMGEIDFRIEELEAETTPERDPADDLPVAAGRAVSKIGDCFELGSHRILCGNALETASYERLLGKQKAAMVFADAPYNLPIDGHVSGFGAVRHREFAMASGELSAAEFTAFLTTACTLLARHSRPGAVHYYCMDWRHIVELSNAARAALLVLLNLCVWAKTTAGMGSFYRSQHELVFVFRNGNGRHRNNIQLGVHGRNRSNLWSYPGAVGLRASEEGNLIAAHPSPKPVAMVADAIMDVSARGDIVLDAFAGGGATLLAAERTARRCYGIELDPLYVDLIVRRWQAFTRQRAIRAADGKYFDEIEAEVESSNAE
jgi:DNA modification methylase